MVFPSLFTPQHRGVANRGEFTQAPSSFQAVLITIATLLGDRDEEVMRGAATNGEFWIFFAYKRSAEQSNYARTEVFHARDVSHLDWVLGILIDWVLCTCTVSNLQY